MLVERMRRITTLVTIILPLVTGFQFRFGSVSALRSIDRVQNNRNTMVLESSAAELADGADDLYVYSPLIRSQPLTALVGKPVYLKLDALQASGSFKVSP